MTSQQFHYKHNRFQQLRGFYYTATIGSISKAAQFLCLTQPTVSLQVKALERELGTSLFRRSGRYLVLTEEGKILMEYAKPIIDKVEHLKENFISSIKSFKKDRITIAANQATMLYLLPKHIKKFTQECPDTKVKIINAVGAKGIEALEKGEADFIIGPNNFDVPPNYHYTPLFYYDPVLITRPEHPLCGKKDVTFKEIFEYPMILPQHKLRTITTLESTLLEHDYKPKANIEFEDWEIIKKYVELDLAITIALSIAIEDDPILVGTPLNHYLPQGSYGLIVAKGKKLSSIAKQFISIIKPSFIKDHPNYFIE